MDEVAAGKIVSHINLSYNVEKGITRLTQMNSNSSVKS